MLSKDEAKEMRMAFWKGFKHYCAQKRIRYRWVLTGLRIPSTQLKFYADKNKALVMFQIDHRNILTRYYIYEIFQSYFQLFREYCGPDLRWEEDYEGVEEHKVSAVYFEISGVGIYNIGDWEKIYAFFVQKMPLLEKVYFDFKDLIIERIKSERRWISKT